MKNILFTLTLLVSFSSFGQEENISVQKDTLNHPILSTPVDDEYESSYNFGNTSNKQTIYTKYEYNSELNMVMPSGLIVSTNNPKNNTEYENIVDLFGVETKIIKGSLEISIDGTSLSFILQSGDKIAQTCIGCTPYGTEFEYFVEQKDTVKIIKGSFKIIKNTKTKLKWSYIEPNGNEVTRKGGVKRSRLKDSLGNYEMPVYIIKD